MKNSSKLILIFLVIFLILCFLNWKGNLINRHILAEPVSDYSKPIYLNGSKILLNFNVPPKLYWLNEEETEQKIIVNWHLENIPQTNSAIELNKTSSVNDINSEHYLVLLKNPDNCLEIQENSNSIPIFPSSPPYDRKDIKISPECVNKSISELVIDIYTIDRSNNYTLQEEFSYNLKIENRNWATFIKAVSGLFSIPSGIIAILLGLYPIIKKEFDIEDEEDDKRIRNDYDIQKLQSREDIYKFIIPKCNNEDEEEFTTNNNLQKALEKLKVKNYPFTKYIEEVNIYEINAKIFLETHKPHLNSDTSFLFYAKDNNRNQNLEYIKQLMKKYLSDDNSFKAYPLYHLGFDGFDFRSFIDDIIHCTFLLMQSAPEKFSDCPQMEIKTIFDLMLLHYSKDEIYKMLAQSNGNQLSIDSLLKALDVIKDKNSDSLENKDRDSLLRTIDKAFPKKYPHSQVCFTVFNEEANDLYHLNQNIPSLKERNYYFKAFLKYKYPENNDESNQIQSVEIKRDIDNDIKIILKYLGGEEAFRGIWETSIFCLQRDPVEELKNASMGALEKLIQNINKTLERYGEKLSKNCESKLDISDLNEMYSHKH